MSVWEILVWIAAGIMLLDLVLALALGAAFAHLRDRDEEVPR